jgi:hypothetical protein
VDGRSQAQLLGAEICVHNYKNPPTGVLNYGTPAGVKVAKKLAALQARRQDVIKKMQLLQSPGALRPVETGATGVGGGGGGGIDDMLVQRSAWPFRVPGMFPHMPITEEGPPLRAAPALPPLGCAKLWEPEWQAVLWVMLAYLPQEDFRLCAEVSSQWCEVCSDRGRVRELFPHETMWRGTCGFKCTVPVDTSSIVVAPPVPPAEPQDPPAAERPATATEFAELHLGVDSQRVGYGYTSEMIGIMFEPTPIWVVEADEDGVSKILSAKSHLALGSAFTKEIEKAAKVLV